MILDSLNELKTNDKNTDINLKYELLTSFFVFVVSGIRVINSNNKTNATVSVQARIAHNPNAFPDACKYIVKMQNGYVAGYPNSSIYTVELSGNFDNKQKIQNITFQIFVPDLLKHMAVTHDGPFAVNALVVPTQCAANIVQNQDAVKRIITGVDMQPQTKSVTDAVAAQTSGVDTASMGYISDTYLFQVNASSATTLTLAITVPKVYADQATPMGRRLLQSTSEITCRMGGFYKVSLFLPVLLSCG